MLVLSCRTHPFLYCHREQVVPPTVLEHECCRLCWNGAHPFCPYDVQSQATSTSLEFCSSLSLSRTVVQTVDAGVNEAEHVHLSSEVGLGQVSVLTIHRRGATKRTGSQRCRFRPQVPCQVTTRRQFSLVRASCCFTQLGLAPSAPSAPLLSIKTQGTVPSCPPVASRQPPVSTRRGPEAISSPLASTSVGSATRAAMQHQTCHLGGRVHDIRALTSGITQGCCYESSRHVLSHRSNVRTPTIITTEQGGTIKRRSNRHAWISDTHTQ